jgi:hypothetical protein
MQNVNELRDRIVRAAECITNEMFSSTWPETEYRLDVCRATGHIEIHWAHKETLWSPVFENISISSTHFKVEGI